MANKPLFTGGKYRQGFGAIFKMDHGHGSTEKQQPRCSLNFNQIQQQDRQIGFQQVHYPQVKQHGSENEDYRQQQKRQLAPQCTTQPDNWATWPPEIGTPVRKYFSGWKYVSGWWNGKIESLYSGSHFPSVIEKCNASDSSRNSAAAIKLSRGYNPRYEGDIVARSTDYRGATSVFARGHAWPVPGNTMPISHPSAAAPTHTICIWTDGTRTRLSKVETQTALLKARKNRQQQCSRDKIKAAMLTSHQLIGTEQAMPCTVKLSNNVNTSGKWLDHESELLKQAVVIYSSQRQWTQVSNYLAERGVHRGPKQCNHRWSKNIRKGAWDTNEDNLLRAEVLRCLATCKSVAKVNWQVLADTVLPERTGRACWERWRYRLDPSIDRSPFTLKQDATLLALHTELGNNWSAIATRMCKESGMSTGTRAPDQIKKRCSSLNRGNQPKTNASNKPASAAAPAPSSPPPLFYLGVWGQCSNSNQQLR
jgi:hypothetical protein